MLSKLYDKARRKELAMAVETNRAIRRFCDVLRSKYANGNVDDKWIRLDLWANGLITALDELEESTYCSQLFAVNISYTYEEDMPEEDKSNYYRHIYFYKNAFIRVFSILDKMGFFMDTLFELETAKVKNRFSYFTVLRQMHKTSTHPYLEQQLYALKERYREPLDRLRRKRNMEIHAMNAELIDDVWRKRHRFADRHEIEPLADNNRDLMQGLEMVCHSLQIIFTYCTSQLKH